MNQESYKLQQVDIRYVLVKHDANMETSSLSEHRNKSQPESKNNRTEHLINSGCYWFIYDTWYIDWNCGIFTGQVKRFIVCIAWSAT